MGILRLVGLAFDIAYEIAEIDLEHRGDLKHDFEFGKRPHVALPVRKSSIDPRADVLLRKPRALAPTIEPIVYQLREIILR